MPANFALLFLQASITCAVAGALAWTLLKLAARIWPALAMQRSVWLMAQAAIACAFLLALLPHSSSFSVLPAIEIDYAVQHAPVPSSAADRATDAPDAVSADEDFGASAWLSTLAQAWLALYCAGLLMTAARWMLAQRHLRMLLASARTLSAGEVATHPAFRSERAHGLVVLETDAAVSPMLVGLFKPRLLLPRHLREFDEQQQQLIVAHELTHWRQRDPLWLHASIALQTALWFNPIMPALGRHLNWAQELSCDQRVLAGRPQQQRQQYAAALVAQLKAQRSLFAAPASALAFGGGYASLTARVKLIGQNRTAPAGLLGRCAAIAMLAVLLAGSMLLQPAFAWRVDLPASADADSTPSAAATPEWRAPLERVRVSSFYGARRKALADGHHGIDFAARSGTPVLATAAGTVVTSTELYDGGAKYGTVIVIDHGKQLRSLYAHLGRRSVQVGDRVEAGQVIGLSGATGKVSGPHLHLEAFSGEQRIDPQRLLAGLDEHASAAALRARAAITAH